MQSNKKTTLVVLIFVTFIMILCGVKQVGFVLSPSSQVNLEKTLSTVNEESTLSAPSAKLCDISNKSLSSASLTIADDGVFFIITFLLLVLPLFFIDKKERFFALPPIKHASIRKHIQLCVFRE